MWTGDNLAVLRGLNSESVDLVYADPPFNSNRDYAAPIGSKAAGAAFKDTWTLSDIDEAWHGEIAEREPEVYAAIDAAGIVHGRGMKSYLIMMAVRLLEIRRVLKPTGSFYLHCDDTADAYLRMLCDAVFGAARFRTQVVWKRSSAHSDTKQGSKQPGRVHDILLFYTKTAEWTWNEVYTPYADSYVGRDYRLVEEGTGRRFRRGDLTAARPGGDTTYEWRVKKHAGIRERWMADLDDEHLSPAAGWEYRGVSPYKGRYWAYSKANMAQFAREGRLRHTYQGMPEYKRYLDEMPGVPLQDVWTDVPGVPNAPKERVGYPTQKPLKLLDRIIKASTDVGDVVLDPFCGCATACVSAESLNRQWVGIDLSPLAARLVESRLRDEFGVFAEINNRTDVPGRTDTGALPNYRTHKHQLFGRQEGRCAGCHVAFPFRNFTIDHRVPRSAGGTDHIDNLQLLCGACNSVKGPRDHAALIADLEQSGILPARAKPIKATLGGRHRVRAKSG